MAQKDRLEQIKRHIMDERTVTVSQLSKDYGVTEETIRRDLEKLEKKGVLTRTYGGALLNTEFMNQHAIHFTQRLKTNLESKKFIAEKAFALLTNENIIGVDSSSTVMEFVKRIKGDSNRTLITNSVSTLFECLQADINVLCAGGYLNRNSLSLQGIGTQSAISNYHLDVAVISCKAIQIDKGIFDTNENEVAVKQTLVSQSKTVILLVDHTKFDQTSFVKFMDLEQVNYIVTDRKPSTEWGLLCEKQRIQLIY